MRPTSRAVCPAEEIRRTSGPRMRLMGVDIKGYRVHPPFLEGVEIPVGDLLELRTVHDAALDKRHELWAGLLVDLDTGVHEVDGLRVGPAPNRSLRSENPDAPVASLQRGGPGTGLYHTHYRDFKGHLGGFDRRRGSRVARDDHQLHVQADQVVYDLERVPSHLGQVAYPVGHTRRVSKVDCVLERQPVPYLRVHRQTAYPRVKDAYGTRITHGVALYTFCTQLQGTSDKRVRKGETARSLSGPQVVEAAGFEPASASAPSVRFYERSSRFSFAYLGGPGRRREASPLSVPSRAPGQDPEGKPTQ